MVAAVFTEVFHTGNNNDINEYGITYLGLWTGCDAGLLTYETAIGCCPFRPLYRLVTCQSLGYLCQEIP